MAGEKVITLSKEDEMKATSKNMKVTTVSTMSGRDEGIGENIRNGSVQHTGPVKVLMYKKSKLGWIPRLVAKSGIEAQFNAGWRATCGDCNEQCQFEGMDERGAPIYNFNGCSAKTSLKFMTCPECGRPIPDDPNPRADALKNRSTVDLDDNEVVDEALLSASDPNTRIRTRLIMHITTFHPQEALNYGLSVPQLRSVI